MVWGRMPYCHQPSFPFEAMDFIAPRVSKERMYVQTQFLGPILSKMIKYNARHFMAI
jgi:hypothetical protein